MILILALSEKDAIPALFPYEDKPTFWTISLANFFTSFQSSDVIDFDSSNTRANSENVVQASLVALWWLSLPSMSCAAATEIRNRPDFVSLVTK